MVVVSHLQVKYAPLVASVYFSPLGEIAVFLFFILPGYIIMEAFFVFHNGRPCAFIANRFFRIYFFSFFMAAFLVTGPVTFRIRNSIRGQPLSL